MQDDQGRDKNRDEAAEVRGPSRLHQIRVGVWRTVLAVVGVLLVAFGIANRQAVEFSWVFGRSEIRVLPGGNELSGGVPLILLLLAAFALGALAGIAALLLYRRRG